MEARPPTGTTRGFDILAFSLAALGVSGLVVLCIRLSTWSVIVVLLAATFGVVSALRLAKLSRQLPSSVSTAGIAVGIFVSGLTASLPIQVMAAPLAFCGAFLCAGLLARRRQLHRDAVCPFG